MGMILFMRMKVKTKWGEVQLSCSINDRNGGLVYAGKDRIGQILPL
jgi:hypothetical protein